MTQTFEQAEEQLIRLIREGTPQTGMPPNDRGHEIDDIPVERFKIIGDIAAERSNQVKMWGIDDHTDEQWAFLLAKHLGKSIMYSEESSQYATYTQPRNDKLYNKLIDIAALASAWAEQILIEEGMPS